MRFYWQQKMNTSTRNWENDSYIILVVSLLTFGGDFSLKSVNLILQTWWDWWILSADATSCNTMLIVLFSTDKSSMQHWSYFRIKILMTECHEIFSFQLKKFWHDRVPPLKVLKSMWTQTAAILVKSWLFNLHLKP